MVATKHLTAIEADAMECREDDVKWPPKNKDGKQELEIKIGNDHISFEVCLSHTHSVVPLLVFQSDRDMFARRLTVALDRENWISRRRQRVG